MTVQPQDTMPVSTPGPSAPDHEPSPDVDRVKILKHKPKNEMIKVHRLRNKLKEAKSFIPKGKTNMDTIIKLISQYLSGPALQIIIAQLKMANVSKKQRRWSNDLKVVCLAIRYTSPKAYRFLRKIMILPSAATLCKPLEKNPIKTWHLPPSF